MRGVIMLHEKISLHRIGITLGSVMLVCFAGVCTAQRIIETGIFNTFECAAAQTALPSGGYKYSPAAAPAPEQSEKTSDESGKTARLFFNTPYEETQPAAQIDYTGDFESSTPDAEEISRYDSEHAGESQYPVLEFTSVQGNTAFAGVQVKNSSSAEINIEEELNSRLGFKIEKKGEPEVLIYHTHTSESFLTYDTGYYYESFYPRSLDPSKNVCAVGEEIAAQLNKAGIKTIHDTTVHDNPSYTGAYYRSADTVQEYLEKYPSIKIVIDIHRDGIGTETERSKPVCMVNGKKAAQFMILAGYNSENDPAFEDWEYNLRFALQMQKKATEMYPDLARPLNFGDFVYNMDINTGSLLIEVGADSNTIEEVRYTGYLLGNIIAKMFS